MPRHKTAPRRKVTVTKTSPSPIAFDGTEDDLMTLSALALKLDVSERTVRRWCNEVEVKLPTVRRNGKPHTTVQAYRRWLAAQNQN